MDKILTLDDPRWWLAALAIAVGLPIFCYRLPETIRALSSYHDTHRRTTQKLQTERAKVDRAIADRAAKSDKGKKGKGKI